MQDENSFLEPKLVGKRFELHTVPSEVLQDFVVLEELLFSVAKSMYLDDNKHRTRVPKGFTEGVSLNLVDVAEGSAILKFLLITNLALAPILDNNSSKFTYFEKAKELIFSELNSLESGSGENVRHLSAKDLKILSKFGRNLKDDESIFFKHDGDGYSTKFDKSTKHKIEMSITGEESYTDRFEFIALIDSVSKSENSFSMIVDSAIYKALIPLKDLSSIITAISNFHHKTYANINGEASYSPKGKILTIESISSIEILDPLDISVRLSELSVLKDGWLDGQGKAPNKHGLAKFEELCRTYWPTKLDLPSIYPTEEGNIQLEWSTENKEISLEVFLPQMNAEFQSVTFGTEKKIHNIDLNLYETESWDILTQFI